jgi:autophagy-related protein 33
MSTLITACKFVGTVSLGLLTVRPDSTTCDTSISARARPKLTKHFFQGVSYTLSTQSLPSLLTLPSAKPAAYTLAQTPRLATLHIRTLSTLASVSLFAAFALSPARIRHPYLLWTGLVAAASGSLNLAMETRLKRGVVDENVDDVNGEEVERRAREQQWIEFVRCGVSGMGFAMGVLGIWGDGS